MKIDGLNLYNLTKSLLVIDELNLKEGQTIIGRIISMSGEDALLDLAGRPLQAKVEGNPPLAPGTTASFKVAADPQGRIVLRLTTNGAENKETNFQNINPKTTPDPVLQKTIISALKQAGLPVTPETTAKVFQYLMDFQAKYQQPISPQVFTFIMAQKWPVTPGTILLALTHQDPKLRDLLWNTLQKSLSQPELTELLTRFVLNPGASPALLAEKLQTAGTSKLQEFLGKLFSLSRPNNGGPVVLASPTTQSTTPPQAAQHAMNDSKNSPQANPKSGFGSAELLKADPNTVIEKQPSPTLLERTDTPESRERGQLSGRETEKPEWLRPTPNNKNTAFNQTPVVKGPTEISPGGSSSSCPAEMIAKPNNNLAENRTEGTSGKLNGAEPQKISATLDQNLTLEKSLNSGQQPGCIIPFLIQDSNRRLHQYSIKWQEERNSETGAKTGESLYLSIPTENLGEIHLNLRIGGAGGIRVNLKVGSEEVRKYLLCHTEDLKKTLGQDSTIITVSTGQNQVIGSEISGLDVWM
jgi:hypothetical protein